MKQSAPPLATQSVAVPPPNGGSPALSDSNPPEALRADSRAEPHHAPQASAAPLSPAPVLSVQETQHAGPLPLPPLPFHFPFLLIPPTFLQFLLFSYFLNFNIILYKIIYNHYFVHRPLLWVFCTSSLLLSYSLFRVHSLARLSVPALLFLQ